jgi:hypothetical protein
LRILWLEHATRVGRYDDWLHHKFALHLRKFVDEVYFYAPYIHERLPKHTPIQYEKNQSIKSIVEKLNIDVIIMDTKGGMFDNYFPKTIFADRNGGLGNSWVPPDFADCKTLKICIEEDFHYETDTKWYEDLGIKVLLQKHYSQYIREMGLPQRFFPFSVDTDAFYPQGLSRERLIGFAGSTNARNALSSGSVYVYRESAFTALGNGGKLAPKTGRHTADHYIDYLQRYIGYVCCGSIFNLSPAKMVEIMASGGVLFTNEDTSGLEQLFEPDTYFIYNNQANDICKKANQIIEDDVLRQKMVDGALEVIRQRHSHDVRCGELVEIIKEYL